MSDRDIYGEASWLVTHMHPELIANLLAGYIVLKAEEDPEQRKSEQEVVLDALAEFYIRGSGGLDWHFGREEYYRLQFKEDLKAAIEKGEQLEADYGI